MDPEDIAKLIREDPDIFSEGDPDPKKIPPTSSLEALEELGEPFERPCQKCGSRNMRSTSPSSMRTLCADCGAVIMGPRMGDDEQG